MKMYWVKFEEDQYARENYETTNQQKKPCKYSHSWFQLDCIFVYVLFKELHDTRRLIFHFHKINFIKHYFISMRFYINFSVAKVLFNI